jgi:hypothetical protein
MEKRKQDFKMDYMVGMHSASNDTTRVVARRQSVLKDVNFKVVIFQPILKAQ